MNTTPFRYFLSITAVAGLAVLAGCSSGHSSPTSPTVTITNPVSTIVSGGAAVTLNATVANDGATPGVSWSLVTTGGTTACAPACGALSAATASSVTYTPPATPPSPATISITATSLSDSTVVAIDAFTITGAVVEAACQASPALRGSESSLTQPIAFLVKGIDGGGAPIAYAGSFTPNGTGGLTAGSIDVVGYDDGAGLEALSLAGSSYSYGADGRGCLSLSFDEAQKAAQKPAQTSAPSRTSHAHHFQVVSKVHPKQLKQHKAGAQKVEEPAGVVFSFAILDLNGPGRIIEFDNGGGGGTVTAGQMYVQAPSEFSAGSLASNFAFGLDGWLTQENGVLRAAIAGSFSNTAGNLSNGYADENVGGQVSGEVNGGYGTLNGDASSTTGRGEGTYNTTNIEGFNVEFDFTYYIIDGSDIFIISSDDPNDSSFMLSGRALQSASSSPALNGWYITALNGLNCGQCEDNLPHEGNNYVSIATLNATTQLAATGTLYSSDGGASTAAQFTGTYALDSTAGRVGFSDALGNAVGYLTNGNSDDGIVAFLVGTDDNAAGGFMAFQSATQPNYPDTAISGYFAFGSAEDVAGDQGAIAGVFNFNDGQFTAVVDAATVASGPSSGQSLSNNYGVNPDGSGAINPFASNPIDLVTNGSLVLAIDTNVEEPLLCILTQTQQNSAGKKKTKTAAAPPAQK